MHVLLCKGRGGGGVDIYDHGLFRRGGRARSSAGSSWRTNVTDTKRYQHNTMQLKNAKNAKKITRLVPISWRDEN